MLVHTAACVRASQRVGDDDTGLARDALSPDGNRPRDMTLDGDLGAHPDATADQPKQPLSPLCTDPSLRLAVWFNNHANNAVDGTPPSIAAPLAFSAEGRPAPALVRATSDRGLSYDKRLLDNLGEATLSLWIQPNYEPKAYSGTATLLHLVHGQLAGGTQLVLKHDASPGTRRISIYYGELTTHLAETDFAKGVWTHLALVWSATAQVMVLYVDGVLAKKAPGAVPVGLGDYLRIGGSTSAFPGELDAVMLFARAFDAGTVKALHAARCE